jgi:hypothetical protein
VFHQVEHDPVSHNREIRRAQIKIPQRKASAVKVLDVQRPGRPFGRWLDVVPKDRVEDLLPPRTREFSRCPGCARIYWQG